METENKNLFDPYRLLFPIGLFASVAGVILWLLFSWGNLQFFPRESHGNIMFFGFLWSFIAGFLMTAVPKMTSSPLATRLEISVAALLGVLQISLTLTNNINGSSYLALVQISFLIFFLLRRFLKVQRIPFAGFLFIPMALTINLIGLLVFIIAKDRATLILLSGEAFVLNLILGLGSRLIPVISRLPNSLMPNDPNQKNDGYTVTLIFGFSLNFSYLLQYLGFVNSALFLRSVVVTVAIIKYFRIFETPLRWTMLGAGLKISALFLALGPFLAMPIFGYPLAGLHLLYLGGFSLITLMISTRVILAHGGQSLDFEIHSRTILLFLTTTVFAAVLRYAVGTQLMSVLLVISGLVFIFGQSLWFLKFAKIEWGRKNSV